MLKDFSFQIKLVSFPLLDNYRRDDRFGFLVLISIVQIPNMFFQKDFQICSFKGCNVTVAMLYKLVCYIRQISKQLFGISSVMEKMIETFKSFFNLLKNLFEIGTILMRTKSPK